MANRLRISIEESGMSQAAVADATGLSKSGIALMLKGRSAPSSLAATRLAATLGVAVDWLIPDIRLLDQQVIKAHRQAKAEFDTARNSMKEERESFIQKGLGVLELVDNSSETKSVTRPIVRIVGFVGAGQEIHAVDDASADTELDTIVGQAGMPSSTVAAIVRGTSLSSVIGDGATLFWSQRRYDVGTFVGKMVVCHLADGRKLIKTLKWGSEPGLFDLMSTNIGPMRDVPVESVSPIDWIKM